MTVIEKKKIIKKFVDKLPESDLDEALIMIQDLASKNQNRKAILLNLLETEKTLFERLAQ
ncbi:hypothetical protein [Tamlana sp. I1]|uniref:hypothetical protein n=1 Tax=Tamlana sp. I1 TaxID=2762061 RepID=UPI00188DC952|nr:hypothetical protein [Tamlana sp. I1]